MIGNIIKFITNKELLLINNHRNSAPLINAGNKKKYVFIDPKYLWKTTFLFGRTSKLRDYSIYLLLCLLNPRAIIDINWISGINTIYYVWAKNNKRKFIVVQHGAYTAGIVADMAHKYTKCQEFWVWSRFWRELFQNYNQGKKVTYKIIGNPVYNRYNRSEFSYKSNPGNKILIACAAPQGERLRELNNLIVRLNDLGFDVTIKEREYQAVNSKSISWHNTIRGNIYDILQSQRYDYVVSDFSSALIDVVFFKTRAIYFSAPDKNAPVLSDNLYSEHLRNLALHYSSFTSIEQVLDFVSIEDQERLFFKMAEPGNNLINIY